MWLLSSDSYRWSLLLAAYVAWVIYSTLAQTVVTAHFFSERAVNRISAHVTGAGAVSLTRPMMLAHSDVGGGGRVHAHRASYTPTRPALTYRRLRTLVVNVSKRSLYASRPAKSPLYRDFYVLDYSPLKTAERTLSHMQGQWARPWPNTSGRAP